MLNCLLVFVVYVVIWCILLENIEQCPHRWPLSLGNKFLFPFYFSETLLHMFLHISTDFKNLNVNNIGIFRNPQIKAHKWSWFGPQETYIWWVFLPAGEVIILYQILLVVSSIDNCKYFLLQEILVIHSNTLFNTNISWNLLRITKIL